MKKHALLLWAAATVPALIPSPAQALELALSRGYFNVPVKSYQEMVFGDVLRQQYDFSCGSAAIASLLSYHYDDETLEQVVFDTMFANGDKTRIEQDGFSLLDMKNYLQHRGYDADGFRLPLEKVNEIGVPAVTLVNFDGYMHFVVVKGMTGDQVILGDPSRGTILMPIDTFATLYQGIVLLVKNHADRGKASFIRDPDYSVYHAAPVGQAVVRDSIGNFTITLPDAIGY
uniref:C39 family peptidase n=1 Tax=Thaumasiovibrio occultus TaxID=1891184 RepID=UPI000B357E91|nr:C39 family peptidase [Thaumasiovibrio occultus]